MTSSVQYSPSVAIAKLAKQMAARNSQGYQNRPANEVLKELLNISDDDILDRFLHLVRKANNQLIKDIESKNIGFDDIKPEYIKSLGSVGEAFRPVVFSQKWGSFVNPHLAPPTVNMQGCSTLITVL